MTRNVQNGLLTGSTLGNVTTSLSHNGFAEVTGESASYTSTPIYDSSFVYDKLGRITQKTETVDSVTNIYDYGYDLAGRLETVSENSTVVSTYAYDDNGNRLSLTTSGGTVSGAYDDQDRLTNYGNAIYTYTANGELETKTVGADTTVYDYDELGNLISVTLPDGTFIEYIIDGRNRRIAKLVDGVFIEGFLYQGQLNPVAKIADTGNIIERYVYADKGNIPAYMIKGASTYRIISDHLGSPRIVVDANTGAIAQRIDYDEFGNVTLDTNPGFQPFGFAGGLYDLQTNLVRFGVRDYDPETGRWAAKDPIRFLGGDTNLYGYVLNDPINWIDPWGLLRVHDDNATQEQKDNFARGVELLKEAIALKKCKQDYFDRFGIDINDVLTPGKGPDVYLAVDADGKYAWYDNFTNDIGLGDSALKSDKAAAASLVHELGHWANDAADIFGNLNPDISDVPEFDNPDPSDGPYGYAAEVKTFGSIYP